MRAGLDEFPIEKEHDRIASILAAWSDGLRATPPGIQAIADSLAADFRGTPPRPAASRGLRPGNPLEVRRVRFAREPALGLDAFLADLRTALSEFSKIITAEFQVTRIDRGAATLNTRTRYELVGTGGGFHREQRVGTWDLEWVAASAGDYRLHRWLMSEETRSRSITPCYADVTQRAFGGNPSYVRQMLHGVDYWRTVLDGACGIDIYGHHGVSAGDIDNDGFDDVYVCQPAGLPNRLYRNRGDGTFEDITEGSGVGVLENTACALFVDVDNDGRQDLVVVRANGPLLFLNQGGGKFRRRPEAFQFATPPQGTFTGAAAADYDRDGWLDIYFCLYVYYQGTDQYRYPVPYFAAENGPPNFMMRNDRDGTFRDVTAETHLERNNTRYSFCCGWSDYNHDGWPDLYVVNDFGRKNLYRNNGDGTFTDIASQAGVDDVGAGMSVCWLDYDNDGKDDLYVANMWTAAGERITMQEAFQKGAPEQVRELYHKHAMGNSLLQNVGGGFQDASASSGTGPGRWAWSSDAWDFDHDGYSDLYIANGMLSGRIRDDLNSFFWRQVVAKSPVKAKASAAYEQGWSAINELIRADHTWSGYERNVFYANNRDGTFSDVSGAVGLDFIEDGRAFALADFDHDGRLEVCLKNRSGPQLRLLKNVMEGLPASIAFRLCGVKSNRDGIGAVITVESEAGWQTRSLQAGSGFLSQHGKDVFFGMGGAKGPVRASIRWPSGLEQRLEGLPVNHRITVEEGAASRAEPFRPHSPLTAVEQPAQGGESLPGAAETWLLVPVRAPDFPLPGRNGQWLSGLRGKAVLLHFAERPVSFALQRCHLVGVPAAQANDVTGVYNVLCSYLFDRHRDMVLPVSFLIDEAGDIVKVYQGRVEPVRVEEDAQEIPRTPGEHLARGLPFPGVAETYEFHRNYLSLGSVYFERGFYEQSEAAFQLALRDDPSSAEAEYGLGSCYLKLEKTGEARACFERAVKLSAGYPGTLPNAWNNLGLLAAREGRTGAAIGYFKQALALDGDHWVALQNLGNAYRVQKSWEEARAALEHALAVRPEDPETNYSLAMVFAQTSHEDAAYEYLQRALKYRPGYPEALNNLGVLYLRTGRRDDAVAKFQECIRVAPAFDQPYLNLARVYSLEDAPQKARTVLLDLLKQRPGHAQAHQMLDKLH